MTTPAPRSILCPDCGTAVSEANGPCPTCGRLLAPVDGVLDLLPAERLTAHKSGQMAFFDAADREWEIERPATAPTVYRRLLEEKFERSLRAIADLVEGASVLVVCAGSGMDAEYLARRGGTVVACDLSPEAAVRIGERSRRHGVRITPVVADVEALPFADRSFDLVYVHDGLHHLEDPLVGLREMARVAGKAVSVNEPALAVLTRGAIGLGLAEHFEEAGNFIGRLRVADVTGELERHGFDVVHASRYGMYYRHEPGRVYELLSQPLLGDAVLGGLRVLNRFAGRLGNKLTVQAVRR
jgi:SAM-dependent methyltransferase